MLCVFSTLDAMFAGNTIRGPTRDGDPQMKRLFVAGVALVALTGAAAAADLPPGGAPYYYKAPYAVPAFNWSGFTSA